MNYEDILNDVLDFMSLSSDEATDRVGRSLNRHNRRISAKLGMASTRKVTMEQTVTIGDSSVTFLGVEKVLAVWIEIDDTKRVLEQHTEAQMTDAKLRDTSDEPTAWAPEHMGSTHVTIMLDKIPETAYTLFAVVIETLADMSGVDEPSFAASYHDALREFAIMDEYRKMEKLPEAKMSFSLAEDIVSELKLFLAKGRYTVTRQGNSPAPTQMTKTNG